MSALILRHHQFDTERFPFWLARLSDEEYRQFRLQSFPIRLDTLFLLDLTLKAQARRRAVPQNNLTELNLPKALLVLEREFGLSSIDFDNYQQTFCFPFLLGVENPDSTFYYLLKIENYRGGIEFYFYRIIDKIEYANIDLNFYHQPIDDEFSSVEIEYVIRHLWGFLAELATHLGTDGNEVNPFFRHIDVDRIVYGYWDGEFIDKQIDDSAEYHQTVEALTNKYGKPGISDIEKIYNIQMMIQSIEIKV